MKIAFAGKGGSGKTTLSSLFTRYLAASGAPVVTIDADINQHLGEALGVAAEPPALGAHLTEIKEWLRGANPRIASASAMVKTTPPGHGSRLLTLAGDDPVHELSVETPCGARLLATGPFTDDDLGVSCYHSKTGAVELYLNHLVDGPGEYVVADLTAGADSFASGLFTRFDLTVLVCEPTRKGVSVYRQWQSYAAGYDVAVVVAGNKLLDDSDLEFLRGETGGGPVVWFGHEQAVRAMEQGRKFELADLGQETLSGLGLLRAALDARWAARDWAAYTRQAGEFHLRNASAWANAATGQDLTAQIDPDFVLGPQALAVTALPERAGRRPGGRRGRGPGRPGRLRMMLRRLRGLGRDRAHIGRGHGPDQQHRTRGMVDDEAGGLAEAFRSEPRHLPVPGDDEEIGAGRGRHHDPFGMTLFLDFLARPGEAVRGGVQQPGRRLLGRLRHPLARVAVVLGTAEQAQVGAVRGLRQLVGNDTQERDVRIRGGGGPGGVDGGLPGAFGYPHEHLCHVRLTSECVQHRPQRQRGGGEAGRHGKQAQQGEFPQRRP
jgi:CO dehydrogenase maturation factor